jgi:inorganic pyrophosphatase
MNINKYDEELLEDYVINKGTEEELDDILERASEKFFGKKKIEDEVLVFIEIGKNNNVKYKYDYKLKALICNQILSNQLSYFFNYGYISHTKSGDGNKLDCIILIDEELISGSYIRCKIVGCLE